MTLNLLIEPLILFLCLSPTWQDLHILMRTLLSDEERRLFPKQAVETAWETDSVNNPNKGQGIQQMDTNSKLQKANCKKVLLPVFWINNLGPNYTP